MLWKQEASGASGALFQGADTVCLYTAAITSAMPICTCDPITRCPRSTESETQQNLGFRPIFWCLQPGAPLNGEWKHLVNSEHVQKKDVQNVQRQGPVRSMAEFRLELPVSVELWSRVWLLVFLGSLRTNVPVFWAERILDAFFVRTQNPRL